MKPRNLFHASLIGSALLAISYAHAETLYWDGNSTSANADGGTGTWINGSTTNWDTLPFGGADSVWTNGANTAVFGGATATVTVGAGGVTVGGLTFNANNYILAAGTNGLNFTSGTNVIQAYIGNNGNTGATITGAVTGTGANLVLRSGADQRVFNLGFSGVSAGGWSGSTTINAGTTLTTTSASGSINQVLNSTSGINLNGGTIQFTRSVTGALNAITDNAISVNGGGTFSVTSTNGSGTAIENIGTVTVNSGIMNFVQTANNQNSVVLAGLSRGSSTTSAFSFSTLSNALFTVSGASATATDEIIGAWAYASATGPAGALSDYAVYNGSSQVVGRNIAASAQSTWSTTHAATSNYTLNTTNVTAVDNGRLTANRNINTLRSITGATAPGSVNDVTDYITMAGNNFQNGDVVVSRNTPGGQMTAGRAYYVINAGGAGAGTFQVSTTPGGSALNLTTTATGFISGGLSLNGFNLGTTGILNGGSDPMAIGSAGGGSITLPTTASGNLYVTNGNASIWIDAPITDNGAGVLTLVKSGTSGNGSGDVTLSGTNTYTGGTVINSGTLTFFNNGAWVSGQDITFGGAGRINASVGALSGDALDMNQGAVGYITGSSAITFNSTTGAGKLVYAGGSSAILALGNASTFTGDLQVSNAVGSNPYAAISFSSIGDTAGSSIQYGGGQGDSNQRGIIVYDGSSALTLENRQIQLLPRSLGNHVPRRNVLMNNSTSAEHKLVIGQNLLNTTDRSAGAVDTEFQLDGTNTGNNEFAGNIGNSTYSNVTNPTQLQLSVIKNGVGKWILSGDNTFTGRLLISNGTLSVGEFNDSTTAGALGMGSVIQLGGAEATPVTGGSGLAATVLLSGSNSGTLEYTGGIASTSRTFQIGSNATGSHTGGGTIANNGTGALTFTATNFNDLIGGVTATRTLTLAGNNTANNEIQGIIRDNVASTGKINLAKNGDGKWILSGANSYTGTTTVNGGSLLINGSTSSTSIFTVNTTATLGGTGSIGGAVTVKNGGTLAPGASIESLASGALTMESGSTFAYEAANSSATGADLLGVNGALSLTDVTLSFDLATLAALSGSGWTAGDKLTLISYTGSDITSGFAGYADDTSYFFGSNEWVFNYNDTVAGGNFAADATANGQDSFVTLTAVTIIPEPSAAAVLAALGILALLRRRR